MNYLNRAYYIIFWGGLMFYAGFMQGNKPENDPGYKAKVAAQQLQLLASNPEMLKESLEVQLNDNLVKAKERQRIPVYRKNDEALAMAVEYRRNHPYPLDISKGWVVGGFSDDGKFYSKQVAELSDVILAYKELTGIKN